MNDIMYLYDVIFLDIIVLHNIISLIWVSIGCFGWTVSDGFRCSEQAEVIAIRLMDMVGSKAEKSFVVRSFLAPAVHKEL